MSDTNDSFDDAFDEITSDSHPGAADEDIDNDVETGEGEPAGETHGEAEGETGDGNEPTGDDEGEEPSPDEDGDGGQGEASNDAGEELAKLEQRIRTWRGRASAADRRTAELQQEIERLRAQLEGGAAGDDPQPSTVQQQSSDHQDGTSQPQSDGTANLISEFEQEFPEVAGPVKKIVQKTVEPLLQKIQQYEQKFGELEPQIQEVSSYVTSTAAEDHFNRIRTAHPDMDQILASGDIYAFINEQPDYIAAAHLDVAQRGSADDVVNLLNQYKAARGISSETGSTTQASRTQAARDKRAAAAEAVRSSPSAPPAGRPAPDDFDGAWEEAVSLG